MIKSSVVAQEQVLLKIACVGVVQALCGSPDAVYCAAGIGEKIYIWHVCVREKMCNGENVHAKINKSKQVLL